jgi:hypothetical protein
MTEMASKDPPRRTTRPQLSQAFHPSYSKFFKTLAQDDCSHHLDCFLVLTCGFDEVSTLTMVDYAARWKKHAAVEELMGYQNRSWAIPCRSGNFSIVVSVQQKQ